MKIRSGFVSNSSSSSFIIYAYNREESTKIYEIIASKLKSENPSINDYFLPSEVRGYIYSNYGLDLIEFDNYFKECIIGCYLDDYKTESQFRKSLDKSSEIFNKFNKDHNIDFYSEAKVFSKVNDNIF